MLCERTRWEKLQGLCSRSPWQPQGIPVRGDWWHGKVSQAPWGRGGRGREEAEVLEPAARRRERRAGWKGHIHLPQDNGGFAGWLWKDTLRIQCFVTHESSGDLSRGPFSSKESCQHLKMQRKQPLSFSRVLKTDFKYYFRQLLVVVVVCWKLLQFSQFPLIAVGGETALQVPSKGSQRWALVSPSFSFCSYLGLPSLCFECFLLCIPQAVTAQERNCCSLCPSWEINYMIARAGMRLNNLKQGAMQSQPEGPPGSQAG